MGKWNSNSLKYKKMKYKYINQQQFFYFYFFSKVFIVYSYLLTEKSIDSFKFN